MARLPVVGQDEDAWGGILNEFLQVEHDTDGTLKRLNQPDGICPLDSNGLVPSDKLPIHAVGGYSAIVYIDGSSIIAEDYKGNTLASGTAGTDDASVLQSAIDYAASAADTDPWKFDYRIVFIQGRLSIDTTITVKSGVFLVGGHLKATASLTYLMKTDKYEDYLSNETWEYEIFNWGLSHIMLDGNNYVTDTVLAVASKRFHFDDVTVRGKERSDETDTVADVTGVVLRGTPCSDHTPFPTFIGTPTVKKLRIDACRKGLVNYIADMIFDNVIIQCCSDVGWEEHGTSTVHYAHVWGVEASIGYTGDKGYAIYLNGGEFKDEALIEPEDSDYGLVIGSASKDKRLKIAQYSYANNVKDIYTEDTITKTWIRLLRSDTSIDFFGVHKQSGIIFCGVVSDENNAEITLKDCFVGGALAWFKKLHLERVVGRLEIKAGEVDICSNYNDLTLDIISATTVNFGATDTGLAKSKIRVSGWGGSDTYINFVNDGGKNEITIRTESDTNLDLSAKSASTRLNGRAAALFENDGSATIANGNTSVTVNHGLVTTPTNIQVTGTHSEVKDAYVTNVGTTSFDIKVGSAVTANRTVYWKATI